MSSSRQKRRGLRSSPSTAACPGRPAGQTLSRRPAPWGVENALPRRPGADPVDARERPRDVRLRGRLGAARGVRRASWAATTPLFRRLGRVCLRFCSTSTALSDEARTLCVRQSRRPMAAESPALDPVTRRAALHHFEARRRFEARAFHTFTQLALDDLRDDLRRFSGAWWEARVLTVVRSTVTRRWRLTSGLPQRRQTAPRSTSSRNPWPMTTRSLEASMCRRNKQPAGVAVGSSIAGRRAQSRAQRRAQGSWIDGGDNTPALNADPPPMVLAMAPTAKVGEGGSDPLLSGLIRSCRPLRRHTSGVAPSLAVSEMSGLWASSCRPSNTGATTCRSTCRMTSRCGHRRRGRRRRCR